MDNDIEAVSPADGLTFSEKNAAALYMMQSAIQLLDSTGQELAAAQLSHAIETLRGRRKPDGHLAHMRQQAPDIRTADEN